MFKYFKTKILLQQRIQSIVVLTLCFYLSLIYPIATKAQQSNKIPISSSIRQLQDPEQRLEAIQTLMNLGKLAVPDLIQALQDNNAQVRADAAFVLERIGKEAESATEALMTALQDNDANVRENAVSALQQVSNKSEIIVLALIPLLQDRQLLLIQDKLQPNPQNNFK